MVGFAFCIAEAIAATNNNGELFIEVLNCELKSGRKGCPFVLLLGKMVLLLELGLDDVLVRRFFSPFDDIEQIEGGIVYGPGVSRTERINTLMSFARP